MTTYEQRPESAWDVRLARQESELREAARAMLRQQELLDGALHELRGLREALASQEQERHQYETHLLEIVRYAQAEADAWRAAVAELARRVDIADRADRSAASRLETLEDTARSLLEMAAKAREGQTDIQRTLDPLVAEVRAQGDAIAALEQQTALIAVSLTVKQDVLDRMEALRMQLQRTEDRLSAMEGEAHELRLRDEEGQRRLASVDGRDRGFNERLSGVQSELAALRAQVTEQFQRLSQAQERSKRRQIEDLEREIREMRFHAYRPDDE